MGWNITPKERKQKDAARMAKVREMESDEQRQRRLEQNRVSMAKSRERDTPGERNPTSYVVATKI